MSLSAGTLSTQGLVLAAADETACNAEIEWLKTKVFHRERKVAPTSSAGAAGNESSSTRLSFFGRIGPVERRSGSH